jgi:carbamoyl-phosphate synthase small subunit
MKYILRKPAVLLLADGTIFYGKSAGAEGTATGEICFNTGMTGYQETFTDPSYYGQLLVATNVHIGNYGIHNEEVESDDIKIAGLICKSFTDVPSRVRSHGSLKEYFIKQDKIAISDVDTRAIVRYIRNKGAMNALISTEVDDIEKLKAQLASVPSMAGLELSSKVSTKEPYFMGNPNAKYKVSVVDYGVKKNILRCMVERDIYVKVFPYNSTFEQLIEWKPNGLFLSNGPGDPSAMPFTIPVVKQMINSGIPVFGICLGHQLIAEASDIPTYKMHNGHRGINHPVKNILTGKCEITSQNHGFAVDPVAVKNNKDIEITHVNLNDDTIEGIRYVNKNVFCVQYHPESSAGPHDSRYLFDEFTNMMEKVSIGKQELNAVTTH